MASFKCPSCNESTLSLIDKYRLGWWMTTHCNNCGVRIAAFPWTLMLIFFFYVWNVVWWAGLVNFNHSYHYLIYMVVCWVVIDLANIYLMPLSALKPKAKAGENSE
ncbi:hypothetical protein ACFL2V_20485 [Pseudomonadota bacterium]